MQSIRVLVVCAMGFTSSLVEESLTEAARKRNIGIELKSGGTGGIEDVVKDYNPSVILLAPQTSFIRRHLEPFAKAAGIKVLPIDHFAYATADGDTILDTILTTLGQ